MKARPPDYRIADRTKCTLLGHALLAVLISLLAHAQSLHGQAPRYSITDLGTLGGDSEPDGLNNAAHVVGFSGAGNYNHAFRYFAGTMSDLHGTVNFGGPGSYAFGINSSGQIVGQSDTPDIDAGTAIYIFRGFIDTNGTVTELGTFGGQYSRAYAINDSGQTVGDATTNGDGAYHAFLYSGGILNDLGTLGGINSFAYCINSSGQVAGESVPLSQPAVVRHAFLYTGGVMNDLGTFGGTSSRALGINDAGDVVGWSQDAANAYRAFIYHNGIMTDINTLGGTNGYAYGINNYGDIVGFAETTGNASYVAFLYYNGTMYDLNTLVGSLSDGRFSFLDNARQINGSDQIAGTGYTLNFGHHAFLATPIVRIDAVSKLLSGAFHLHALGLPARTHTVKAANTLAQTFLASGPATADANGALSFDDSDAPNHTTRFYRVTFP